MRKFSSFLFESITISVPENERKIEIISDLAQHLNDTITKTFNIKNAWGQNQVIDMDGFDVNAKKGILNFYVRDVVPKDKIDKIIKALEYYIQEMGWAYGKITNDMSKMYNIPTYRIPVSTADKSRKPYLNISHENAEELFRNLLNYSDQEYQEIIQTGQLSIRDLHIKLNNYINVKGSVKPPSQEKNIYDGGRSEEQIENYLKVLQHLVDLAMKSDQDYLSVS